MSGRLQNSIKLAERAEPVLDIFHRKWTQHEVERFAFEKRQRLTQIHIPNIRTFAKPPLS